MQIVFFCDFERFLQTAWLYGIVYLASGDVSLVVRHHWSRQRSSGLRCHPMEAVKCLLDVEAAFCRHFISLCPTYWLTVVTDERELSRCGSRRSPVRMVPSSRADWPDDGPSSRRPRAAESTIGVVRQRRAGPAQQTLDWAISQSALEGRIDGSLRARFADMAWLHHSRPLPAAAAAAVVWMSDAPSDSPKLSSDWTRTDRCVYPAPATKLQTVTDRQAGHIFPLMQQLSSCYCQDLNGVDVTWSLYGAWPCRGKQVDVQHVAQLHVLSPLSTAALSFSAK